MSNISRRVYTHNVLLGVTTTLIEQANKNEFDNSMTTILMCALTIEAFLNHLGNQLFKCWQRSIKKGLSSRDKLELIAEKINLEVKYGSLPFQSFSTIFRFRNQIAHAQTEDCNYIDMNQTITMNDKKWSATKWEILCTKKSAIKFVEDTKNMIKILEDESGLEKIPAFLLSEHVVNGKKT